MKVTLALFMVVCAYKINGLIMPMTKTDGSLDVSSLVSHITLLEQSLENKASQTDVTRLEAQLAKYDDLVAKNDALQGDVTKLEAQLSKSNDELKSTQIEVAVLKNQLSTQCSCNSSANNNSPTSSELSSLRSDVGHLKQDVIHLQSLQNKTSSPNGGSTYTRWGRTSCPADSNVVYKGYTGGSWFEASGASSIVCLPEHPVYGIHTPDHHDLTSNVFGAEYQTGHYSGSPLHHLYQEDIPCVVCETPRSKSIMVPGRKICHQGWTLEYWGYLMSETPSESSADYICIDSDAEAIPGGQANDNGRLLYPVESRCGSLPCPPYVNYWEVSCAVCSK